MGAKFAAEVPEDGSGLRQAKIPHFEAWHFPKFVHLQINLGFMLLLVDAKEDLFDRQLRSSAKCKYTHDAQNADESVIERCWCSTAQIPERERERERERIGCSWLGY